MYRPVTEKAINIKYSLNSFIVTLPARLVASNIPGVLVVGLS